jgi:hypothetical protein
MSWKKRFGKMLSTNTFTGNCSLNFYSCSLAQCPGPLQVGPVVYQISARRF